jgi:hypothetical protein
MKPLCCDDGRHNAGEGVCGCGMVITRVHLNVGKGAEELMGLHGFFAKNNERIVINLFFFHFFKLTLFCSRIHIICIKFFFSCFGVFQFLLHQKPFQNHLNCKEDYSCELFDAQVKLLGFQIPFEKHFYQ